MSGILNSPGIGYPAIIPVVNDKSFTLDQILYFLHLIYKYCNKHILLDLEPKWGGGDRRDTLPNLYEHASPA